MKDELKECLREETEEEVERLAARKANSTSILVILSRITGFGRTMAQANALFGALMSVASCYTVAAGMPNMLYELVMGGMLVTSFLPVYLSVRNDRGRESWPISLESAYHPARHYGRPLGFELHIRRSDHLDAIGGRSPDFDSILRYRSSASSLSRSSCMACPRWFRVCSTRSATISPRMPPPMVNNIITIASFMLYSLVVKGGLLAWDQALIILAVGNPLGVVSQVLIQLPALRRHGVRLRLKIDLHDPALRQTLAIGLPTF